MKIKKLLSVILTINQRDSGRRKGDLPSQWIPKQVDELYGYIQEFDRLFEQQGKDLALNTPELPDDKVTVNLQVTGPSGKGTSAVVRFFPVIGSYSSIDNRIDFFQKYTDESGIMTAELPLFRQLGFARGKIGIREVSGYRIEISKGSEFLTECVEIAVAEGKEASLMVNMLRFADLGSRGWYAGDLHHHSVYSSPLHGGTDDVVETPREVMNAMKASGLSFGALSDHHNILNHEEWKSTGDEDFLPIVSKEISTSNGHIMSLNVSEDIIYRIPSKEKRTHEYLLKEFIRTTGMIRKLGGLAQINHPRDMQKAISLSEEMTKHINLFETMEIWNGSVPMMEGTTNNDAYELWLSLLRKDNFIPATAGSDTHNIAADDYNLMADELSWFSFHINSLDRSSLPPDLAEKYELVADFISLFDIEREKLELWAKQSLGTACVRIYVNCPGTENLTPETVLEALRKGKSILTNGPLLLPSINGAGCGDVLKIPGAGKLIFKGSLFFNRKLRTLELISKRGILKSVDLVDFSIGSEHIIELPLETEKLEARDWVICRAFSDHTNQIIANPVFIEFE